MTILRIILAALLALAPITLAAQQNVYVTNGTQHLSRPAASGNETDVFPVQTGNTQHQVTFTTAPSVSAITVTVTGSTDGGSFAACGSSTSLGATITCSGTYQSIKIAITGYAGSGAVTKDYFGSSSVGSPLSQTQEVDIKTINAVAPTQTSGGGLAVTIVSGTLVTDYAGTQGMTVIASGSTSAMTAVTSNVASIECNNVSAAGANTVTVMDGNGKYYLGPNFSIPASSNIVLNWFGGARFTSGVNISAGAANVVQCEVSPGSKQ